MAKTKNPADPDFPHGTPLGYKQGCRKTSPCPATPTCQEVGTARDTSYRNRRDPNETQDAVHASHVKRRLEQTIAKVGLDALLEDAGVDAAHVDAVRTWPYVTMEPHLAEPLDHSWSWLVHGSNTRAPDFPHGRSAASYASGSCRCLRCRSKHLEVTKATQLGRIGPNTFVVLPGLADHTKALIEAAGSGKAVARVCGIGGAAVAKAAEGQRVRARIARTLLRTTHDECARHARRKVEPRAYRQVRSMQALGYTLQWISARTRISYSSLQHLKPDTLLAAERIEVIASLAAQVGDTPADPERDGIEPRDILRTAAFARRAGHYPPIYYDENGNLDYRTLPDHPWARLDAKADSRVRAAHLLVATELTQGEVAAETGISDKRVGEVAQALGVVYAKQGKKARDVHSNRAITARVLSVVHDYDTGQIGPVTAALMLDVLGTTRRSKRKPHPELAAWDAAAATIARVRFAQQRIAHLVATAQPQPQAVAA